MTAQFRWTQERPDLRQVGERRLSARWLWLPMSIDGDVRWFGVESFYEEWGGWRVPTKAGITHQYAWRPVQWLNP